MHVPQPSTFMSPNNSAPGPHSVPLAPTDSSLLPPPPCPAQGAEIYTVRVFNQTGDVMQGEGIVYGSSLVSARWRGHSNWGARECGCSPSNRRGRDGGRQPERESVCVCGWGRCAVQPMQLCTCPCYQPRPSPPPPWVPCS